MNKLYLMVALTLLLAMAAMVESKNQLLEPGVDCTAACASASTWASMCTGVIYSDKYCGISYVTDKAECKHRCLQLTGQRLF
ncbi:hypothetical protein DFA_02079 [Cavenderia fasciculata]|uniref:Transmembrane protein n=1 Tax=Cavenderia fasciculata TaxID=261658 RepID=F4PYM6_CACFS|nr:uncharacterized protein DFA_02079 [Cavenderia fasciculata]EGG19292.1 hypothetical protein DFA_02079 [Cavenderia fasciculata]|eukprot:XP_004357563.1 hypothetical protein DFA_02079 [Cavenderia fasciculata]